MYLTNNEVTILKELKKIKRANDALLSSLTGLNKDAVRRSCYFLSEKGLVEIKKYKKILYKVTELGKHIANSYLPEEMIVRYDNVKEIPRDIMFALGKLKEKGFVKIENEKIVMLRGINEYPLMKFKELAKNTLYINEQEILHLLDELIKRGYVKEEKEMEKRKI